MEVTLQVLRKFCRPAQLAFRQQLTLPGLPDLFVLKKWGKPGVAGAEGQRGPRGKPGTSLEELVLLTKKTQASTPRAPRVATEPGDTLVILKKWGKPGAAGADGERGLRGKPGIPGDFGGSLLQRLVRRMPLVKRVLQIFVGGPLILQKLRAVPPVEPTPFPQIVTTTSRTVFGRRG
jgi:hypothetical protein